MVRTVSCLNIPNVHQRRLTYFVPKQAFSEEVDELCIAVHAVIWYIYVGVYVYICDIRS